MSLPFIGTNGCPEEVEGCENKGWCFKSQQDWCDRDDEETEWFRKDCQKLCGLGVCPPRPCFDKEYYSFHGGCVESNKWKCDYPYQYPYFKPDCRKLCGVCKEE